MPLPKNEAWFYAKTHGWGWGLPARWQGWVVLLGFVVLLGAGGWWLMPARHPHVAGFIAYSLGLGCVLLLICWSRGEAPRWRRGDDDK